MSVGAKHAIYNIFQALLNEGDEVIILAPYWVSYPEMVQLAGGKPVIVETREEDGFAPDPDAIRRALSPRTKAVVLNSPSNPSGAVFSRAALEGIAQAVRGHDCLVVSDDIYEKLLYQGAVPEHRQRGAGPGAAAGRHQRDEQGLLDDGLAHGVRGGTQVAHLGHADDPGPVHVERGVLRAEGGAGGAQGPAGHLRAHGGGVPGAAGHGGGRAQPMDGVRCRRPEGAFYVLPNVSGLMGRMYKGAPLTGSMQMSEILLNDFRVAAMPGAPFGAEGYIRMSFATSREQLRKGLERFREFVGFHALSGPSGEGRGEGLQSV